MSIASPKIRKLAVEAYLSGKATQQQLADIFGFHRTAIVRWVREYREEGKLEPRRRGHLRRAFSPEEREALIALVKEKPHLTLEEIRKELHKDCSLTAVQRELKRLGFRLKKCQDENPYSTRRYIREQDRND